jgi:hypothetical protein
MNDDNDIPPVLILLMATAGLFFTLGFTNGTSIAQKETQEKTISYCIKQPTACKTKYDFYKLENSK